MKSPRSRRQAVRRIRRRLDKAGLLARAAAVLAVAQGQEFKLRLNAEVDGAPGDWIRDDDDGRKVLVRILNAMKVDHRDITLTVKWTPSKRRLDVWARPAHAIVQEIAGKAKLRAIPPSEQPPKNLAVK
jgi:hypothetical protein